MWANKKRRVLPAILPVATNLAPDRKPTNRRQHMKNDRVTNPATNELSEAELEKATGGSQSSGSDAGKVTLHPLSITRKMDKSSPTFF
jgi:hypothetical protein